MISHRLLPSLLALAAASGISASAAFGQATSPSSLPDPVDHEAAQPEPIDPAEILAAEANQYARAYGVSVDEAMRRLAVMHGTGSEIRALEAEVGDQLAGTYFDNSGKFQLVVRTTGEQRREARRLTRRAERRDARRQERQETRRAERRDARRAERRAARLAERGITEADLQKADAVLDADQSAPVVFQPRARKAERVARRTLRQNRESIASILATDDFGFGYNVQTGAYRFWAPNLSDLETKRAELSALLNGEVELEATSTADRLTHIRGGGGLHQTAGVATPSCTTGFVAYLGNDRSRLGVLTAGHCRDTMWYRGADAPDYPIQLNVPSGYEAWNSNMDLQWMTGDHITVGQFYADNSTAVRNVTGYRSQANTTQANDWFGTKGSFICHYGKTTGYSCGEVIDTDAAPGYSCNGWVCNDVFVEVRNKVIAGETQLACGEGDSGGPWFANGVAFGIHSGCRFTGTRPGQTEAAFYTSIEKASALNVTIFIP